MSLTRKQQGPRGLQAGERAQTEGIPSLRGHLTPRACFLLGTRSFRSPCKSK